MTVLRPWGERGWGAIDAIWSRGRRARLSDGQRGTANLPSFSARRALLRWETSADRLNRTSPAISETPTDDVASSSSVHEQFPPRTARICYTRSHPSPVYCVAPYAGGCWYC